MRVALQEARYRDAVLAEDLRSKIYSLLLAVDFDARGHSGTIASAEGNLESKLASPTQAQPAAATAAGLENLPVEERIFLRGCREYAEFRKAASWQDVKAELQAQGVNPIHQDSVYMEKRLEKGFNLALAARQDQRQIRDGDTVCVTLLRQCAAGVDVGSKTARAVGGGARAHTRIHSLTHSRLVGVVLRRSNAFVCVCVCAGPRDSLP